MSDQQAPGATPDTSAVAGPNAASGAAEDIDWQARALAAEDRYGNLQPEYTRVTQREAELREQLQYHNTLLTSEDEDTRRQALEALGYEVPDPEPQVYEDPTERIAAQVSTLAERLDTAEQAQRQEQEQALMNSVTFERLNAIEGLAKEDQNWVLSYAVNALPAIEEPGIPVPLPDVKAAYEVFKAREIERQREWANGKRAPYVAPGGQTATEVPNLDTHQGRVDAMMRGLRDQESLT